jgi:acyl transferase domain-containing protein
VPTIGTSRDAALRLVFTGQGAQWAGTRRELLTTPTFAESIERAQVVLQDLGCAWTLVDLMCGASTDSKRLEEAQCSQVVTTAVQIALVDLLTYLQVTPAVVVGYSSGEIAAAYAAGHLDATSAIRVSYHRGMLCSGLERSGGVQYGMAVVGLPREDVEAGFQEMGQRDLVVSCVNSPTIVTVSGPAI